MNYKYRELKKQLRQLKNIKLQVLEGKRNDYTEEQLNQSIDKIRKKLGVKEDREKIIEMEQGNNLDLTYSYEVFLEDSKTMTIHQISVSRSIPKKKLIEWVERKRKRKNEMGKITVKKFKEAISAGKTLSEIAEEFDVKELTVLTYKNQWKKQGLLDGIKKIF